LERACDFEPFALSPCARGFAYGGVVSVHEREANTQSSTTMAGTRYDLEDRLIRFGVAVCRACEQLPETVVGKHVKVQLVRSATSPAANYGEVQGAESRRDFIHKLGICLKELRETRAWLKFIAEMEHCPAESMQIVLTECEELLAIIASSIRTARSNERNRM
jgi:four helix bundle protein